MLVTVGHMSACSLEEELVDKSLRQCGLHQQSYIHINTYVYIHVDHEMRRDSDQLTLSHIYVYIL